MRCRGLHVPSGLSRADWDRVAGQWVASQVRPYQSVVVDGSELVECAGPGEWVGWVATLPAGAAVSLQVGNGVILGLSVPAERWQEVAL